MGDGRAEHYHVRTPLLESWVLSQVLGTTVYLKCENVQPAGSFKIRGIGHYCQEMAKKGCRHLVCSSGHASLVQELKADLGSPPGALVLAVGGGGLLAGVAAGLEQVGWQDVPVVAVETRGADSFHAALRAGKLVTLPDITSVARCLGAKTVAAGALACAKQLKVLSEVVADAEAVSAVQRFLDDERMLVEPACGAALAAVYSGVLGRLQAEGRLPSPLASVVVIVCGGNSIDSRELQALKPAGPEVKA
ncbi:LOW QUALITY PROTEIN: serine dehydratase-like [Sorex araneus]|uniref:LOW QUALITY PROTEIN: serine dehydratase-like n=1 Tax=Sorex araneus TaxID=42254 RepID=UPI0024338737|nr:LOW QUALITY PROTEIN: serine dehydratase-like [Sorex araneus]